MRKPVFNPEITWGTVMAMVIFVFGMIPVAIVWGTEVKVLRKDVDGLQAAIIREQIVNEKLAENQNIVAQTLVRVDTLLTLHLQENKP